MKSSTERRNALAMALCMWQHKIRDADRRKHGGTTNINLMLLLNYQNLVHALGQEDAIPCPKCYIDKNETIALSSAHLHQEQEWVTCHSCAQQFHTTIEALEPSLVASTRGE